MIWVGEYDCVWTAKGTVTDTKGVTSDVEFKLASKACFGDAIRKIRSNASADLSYKVYFRMEDYKHASKCLLSLTEVRKALRSFQLVVPFDYKLGIARWKKSNWTDEEVDTNVVLVKLNGDVFAHIFVTTMLRILFEYPYNVAAYDTFRAKREKIVIDGVNFSKISWINLYFIIAAVMNGSTGHGLCQLSTNPKLHEYKEFKKLLNTPSGKKTWGAEYVSQRICDGKGLTYGEIPLIHVKSFKTLKSPVEFSKRCAVYAKFYKIKQTWK